MDRRRFEIEKKRRERAAVRKATIKAIICICILIAVLILCGGTKNVIIGYEYDECNSLWELAEKHCPESMDKRRFIDVCRDINGMANSVVYPNRLYQYPVYEEAFYAECKRKAF